MSDKHIQYINGECNGCNTNKTLISNQIYFTSHNSMSYVHMIYVTTILISIILQVQAPPPAGTCDICPSDYFCSQGSKTACPLNSYTKEETRFRTGCTCSPGFVGNITLIDGLCKPCPIGKYCEGGTHEDNCPTGSTSDTQTQSIQDCFCKPGMYGSNEVCDVCLAGS